MLHLLLGTDWTACRDEVLARISRDVKNEKGGRILMVPELISHDTERRLCAAAGDTASRFAEVLSFTRLGRRVCEQMEVADQECLDAGGRLVAMAAAARSVPQELRAYGSVATNPEFLAQIIEAIDEFKRCCITASDLMAASDKTEGRLSEKLKELSLLMSAYDAICENGKRDPREKESLLLELMADGDFAEKHVFYIDGFPDFTRQHMEILEHLIRFAPQVTISINCPADKFLTGETDNDAFVGLAFEKAHATALEILHIARRAGVPCQVEQIAPHETPLEPLRRKLFQGDLAGISLKENVSVLHADGIYDECVAAAEKIMALVRGGCRYRDITVVCGDLGGYKPQMEMVFERCGIPLYLSGTEDILDKSVVVTVLAALDAALDGFEQRSMLRYLRSILSPIDPDTCDLVENYAVTWAIRGKRWTEEWTNHPQGLQENWTEDDTALLARLNEARALAVTPLDDLRRSFGEAKNLGEQVRAIYTFLEEIHLAEHLDALAQELDAGGDNRSAQILNQLWEILLGAMEQLYDVLGDTVWDGESFTRLLRLLLSQYDVGTIPPVLDAVQAGQASAMRCHQPKHLIVLGGQEGNLPGYSGSTGLLTDQERDTLRKLDLPLTGGSLQGIQAEFAEIYGCFCGASETVTVCYNGTQPSFITRRIAAMAGSEGQTETRLAAAQANAREAGAYLASLMAADAAERIGIADEFDEICRRRGYTLGTVARENIEKLYGKVLHLSASQVNTQAECRLSYFLNYGLRAKERKEAAIDPAEFGTYVHEVLEKTVADVMELGGFHEVTLEQTQQIAAGYSDAYAKKRFSVLSSERLDYLFQRNRRELEIIVEELWKELSVSEFQPAGVEVKFDRDGVCPPIQLRSKAMRAYLRGLVDRVDTWQWRGQSYYRVVDYKTGKKDFDYTDILSGVGLQMLLYLFALENGGSGLVGSKPQAAGVQYFSARVPYVSIDGQEDADKVEKERKKNRKHKGLLLNESHVLEAMEPRPDPDGRWEPQWLSCKVDAKGNLVGDIANRSQLRLLEEFVMETLGQIVDEIASGNVTPNPYTRGTSHNACAFCPFGAVCHETEVEGRRNRAAVDAGEFWEEIERRRDPECH